MRRRIGRVALALAAASCVPLMIASCKHDGASAEKGARRGGGGRGGGGGGRGGAPAFAVDTMIVQAKKLDYVVTAPGTLDAFERVQVTARVAGAVDRVAFVEGQEVKKGEVLVVIDSERFRLALNSAQASLNKAKAAQADNEAMVARREGASDTHPGLIPGEELATYRTKVLTAKADTALATESVKVAKLNLRDAHVRAPMGGVIQTRTVETGQYVNPGYVMATLLRSDPLLLRFEVEPRDAPRLKPGMKATFTMRETQRVFDAKITLVAGAADPTTHMVAVTGEVDNDRHKYWLRPGSFCDVSIDVGATRDAPVIPRSATRATDHGYVTYVVKDGVAEERVVTLGMSSKDGWIEVRSGLEPGEAIVVRGAEALSTGAKVKARQVTGLDASAPEPQEVQAKERRGRGDAGARRRRRRDASAPRPKP